MIRLESDLLMFETAEGELYPCSSALMHVDIMGEPTESVDSEMLQQAADAVYQYYQKDLGRRSVTVKEFSDTLKKALTGIGLLTPGDKQVNIPLEQAELDLKRMVLQSGISLELSLFPLLRHEMQRILALSPQVVRFTGLRAGIKQLLGVTRWNRSCQEANVRLVDFIRNAWRTDAAHSAATLVIQ